MPSIRLDVETVFPGETLTGTAVLGPTPTSLVRVELRAMGGLEGTSVCGSALDTQVLAVTPGEQPFALVMPVDAAERARRELEEAAEGGVGYVARLCFDRVTVAQALVTLRERGETPRPLADG